MGQNGCGQGHGTGSGVEANLAYTKFLFVVAHADDDAYGARLRTAGGNIARGFVNDFDIDDSRENHRRAHPGRRRGEAQPFEAIQFFVRDGGGTEPVPNCVVGPCINTARHLVQVSSNYRPRLQEIDEELRRRIGDAADVIAIDGALRTPRYSSPEMVHYSNKGAPPRRSGRISRNAIIMPIRKTAEWWQKSPLERHAYFYPHIDSASGCPVKGHAVAAERGIASLFRRVYYNPDGYERPDEFDFMTYFECEDEGLPVFDEVLLALRDVQQNPEWRYVQEGPIWRGRRVLRW